MKGQVEIAQTTAAANQAVEMTMTLSIGLAIRDDRNLRRTLADLAGVDSGSPFAVGRPDRQPWFKVEGHTVVAMRQSTNILPVVETQCFADEAGASGALRAAFAGTSASVEAATLIGALFGPELPSRQTFRQLRQWTPVLEQTAYAGAAALISLLDDTRPEVLAAASADAASLDPRITQYWCHAHALANLTLLSADAGARSWLIEMADQFVWEKWTPTFPLIRERTIWLAACAARSAAAFGEPVVSKYLASLAAADSPLKAFDALFGLAAIGLTSPATSGSIRRELCALRESPADRKPAHAEIYRMAYDDVIELLAGKGAEERKAALEIGGLAWPQKSLRGLATTAALRQDPARFTAAGRFLGFAILPIVLNMPPENFYPSRAAPRSARYVVTRDAVDVIRNTWLLREHTPKTLH